ncbi:hypothetical protein [Nocardioides yefusunii]|uniref:Uncharacterized protein n=1 Tax=Nocardioides yefusunii TaxID=2500546 RepID=A0ABW1QZ84_9ACTN|nr:hypothetical protein [Nocardioides yefusunii]
MELRRLQGWIITGTGALALLGAFLPWASVLGMSVSGFSGDGKITAFLALVTIALGVLRGLDLRGGTWLVAVPVAAIALGGVIAAIGIYNWTRMSSAISGLDTEIIDLSVSVGFGLMLTTLARVAVAASGAFALLRKA